MTWNWQNTLKKKIMLISLKFNRKLDGDGLFAYFQYIRGGIAWFHRLIGELRWT